MKISKIYRIWYLYRDLKCETYAHNFREYPYSIRERQTNASRVIEPTA
jgi:hypothetical protein